MATIEHSAHAPEASQPEQHRFTLPVVVVVGVVALVLGGIGGLLIASSEETSGDATEVVTGEITDRQQEMLEVIEELDAAIQAGAADAALVDRLFVPQGVYRIRDRFEYRVDDGSLAEFFERGSDTSAVLYPAALVADDMVVRLGDYSGGYSHTFKFTSSGDVRIIWAHIQN